jgi:hypothetical protein
MDFPCLTKGNQFMKGHKKSSTWLHCFFGTMIFLTTA